MELQGTLVLTGSERARARDSREVLQGLEAIHDRSRPIGPPAFDHTPNVPPFPNITFGGPLNQRDENANWFAENH